jgi:hypothetical protein
MLSYHAIGAEQAMHAGPGWTSERLSGTRAATTFRKLPIARPGAKASAARAELIPGEYRLVPRRS